MKFEGYLNTVGSIKGQKIQFDEEDEEKIRQGALMIVVEKTTKQGGKKKCFINLNQCTTIDYWEIK